MPVLIVLFCEGGVQMNRVQARVWKLADASWTTQEFRMAVSLHSHTHHSKEPAEFIPLFVERIPVLSRLVAIAMRRYQERTGIAVDFRRIYWTPPVSPSIVFRSEVSQIEEELGLSALVSITDHDTIVAPLELRQQPDSASIPISVEWTVPFADTSFHVGVHHLPPAGATEIMKELSRYTAEPNEGLLGNLLTLLDGSPETLLVLNHPCCDFYGLGAVKHEALLREFLTRWRDRIHALEFNAMRTWGENQQAVRVAEKFNLPVVAGGDRHGCRPNAVLNLSHVENWGEYVSEIRSGRRSDVLILPACEEPVRLRELQTVADIVRHYPSYPYGYRQFTDRVFVDLEGYSWHPLSFYWSGGMPLWLRPLFSGLAVLGSNRARPALRWFLSLLKESALATFPSDAVSN
jgi:hypothetical protein